MGYILATPEHRPLYHNRATCDNCGEEILVEHDRGLDALEITLDGGYGSYIDFCSGPAELLWCINCSDKLLQTFPSLNRIQ